MIFLFRNPDVAYIFSSLKRVSKPLTKYFQRIWIIPQIMWLLWSGVPLLVQAIRLVSKPPPPSFTWTVHFRATRGAGMTHFTFKNQAIVTHQLSWLTKLKSVLDVPELWCLFECLPCIKVKIVATIKNLSNPKSMLFQRFSHSVWLALSTFELLSVC